MVLRNVEQMPAYRALLEDTLDRLARQLGHGSRRAAGMKNVEGFIFVASAGSVTPFHADYEENLFLHLAGPKTFHLFDNRDRSFVSEADLETFPGKHRNLAYDDAFHDRGEHHVTSPMPGRTGWRPATATPFPSRSPGRPGRCAAITPFSS
jgi:hypothetical protein